MPLTRTRNELLFDLAMVAFLVGLGVAARLLPHPHGFLPVAASGLFAARMLHMPKLAVVVPIAAMGLSGFGLAGDDWRIALIVYAGIALPAVAGMLTRHWRGVLPVAGTMVGCSLIFFAASNLAVWAFSGMYPLTWDGLVACYVAALPFLDKTVLGDLFWTAVLFGSAWLVQHRPWPSRTPL